MGKNDTDQIMASKDDNNALLQNTEAKVPEAIYDKVSALTDHVLMDLETDLKKVSPLACP